MTKQQKSTVRFAKEFTAVNTILNTILALPAPAPESQTTTDDDMPEVPLSFINAVGKTIDEPYLEKRSPAARKAIAALYGDDDLGFGKPVTAITKKAETKTPTALRWNVGRMGSGTKVRFHVVVLTDFNNGNLSRKAGDALCDKTADDLSDMSIMGDLPMCPTCRDRARRYNLTIPGHLTAADATMTSAAQHQPLSNDEDVVMESYLQQFKSDTKNGEFRASRSGGGGFILFDGQYHSLEWVKANCDCAHCQSSIRATTTGVVAHKKLTRTGNNMYPICESGHLIVHGRDLRWKVSKVPNQTVKAGSVETVKAGYGHLIAAGAENVALSDLPF